LILHDSRTSSSILDQQLRYWGFRCSLAEDVREAIRVLEESREDPIQLLFVDLRANGSDAETFATALQSDPRFGEVRVFVFVPFDRADGEYAKVGSATYVGWPLRPGVLRNVLITKEDRPLGAEASATRQLPNFKEVGYRILLVEDNVTNQKVVVGLLKKFGLNAEVAADGRSALRVLAAEPYDLVLMDLQMPIMDGMEATQHIRDPRSTVLNHDIPIIALSAHALQGTREECVAAGMNDHLAKPVSPNALADMLTRWLPSRQPTLAAKADDAALLFDYAGMLQRMMNDEHLAHDVILGFLDDMPGQIAEIQRFGQERDVAKIARQAHQIRGAAANVGAEALRALAGRIEEAARRGDGRSTALQIDEMEPLFSTLKEAMLAVAVNVVA
jgi:CheY-like chemotaxis protein/HPt (histidine-containing phosphotransfer) domain-containing protein